MQGFHQLQAIVGPWWVSVHANCYIEKKKDNQTLTGWLRNKNVSEFRALASPRSRKKQTNSRTGSNTLPSSCKVSHSGKVKLSLWSLKSASPIYKGCTLINLTTTQSSNSHHIRIGFQPAVLGGHRGTLTTVADPGPCYMGPGSAGMQYSHSSQEAAASQAGMVAFLTSSWYTCLPFGISLCT